jgi:hypothetical protein
VLLYFCYGLEQLRSWRLEQLSGQLHEQFERPELPLPPDRSTGLVFTAVALVVAFFWRSNPTVLTIALVLAAILAAVSFTVPSVLRPLNIAWMRFAVLLSKIMNPIVMLVLFAVAIVPAGLIMQLLRDPLRRRKSDTASHWIPVAQAERSAQSNMKNQF